MRMDYRNATREECIEQLEAKDAELERLRESERRYHAIFRNTSVALWEEDCSAALHELDRLMKEGVEDLRGHLRAHPELIRELVRRIRILDVNEAALELYGAENREQLLGSLESIFTPETEGFFIEEMVAMAERRGSFEGETVGRRLDGASLHLLIRMSIPREWEEHDYVLLSMIDISARKQREAEYARLLEETEEQRVRAESMREITLALTSTFESSRILDTILQHAGRLVRFTAVNVSLLEEGRMRIVRFDGYEAYGVSPEEVEGIFNRVEPENVTRLIRNQEPVLIPDTAEEPEWIVCEPTAWVRSYLGIPLQHGSRLLGLINFDSDKPEAFGREDIRRLEPFVHAAAVALENARLYEELQRELSERRSAEERLRASLREKEVLLEEIHHRVKNNLNVVASMLSLQLGRIETVEEARNALRMSENRIHSMSLVHEHLYQSENLSAVDIGAYLEAISADLRQVYQGEMPIEIRTASDRIYLDIYQAIPLGLILNELISNALEHAFLPRESGSLWVSLSYHPGRAGWCDLRVKDNGGGSTAEGWDTEDVSGGASEAAETRLGLELVRILSEQLGGSLTLVREEGTEFLLSFPADCGYAERGRQCSEE